MANNIIKFYGKELLKFGKAPDGTLANSEIKEKLWKENYAKTRSHEQCSEEENLGKISERELFWNEIKRRKSGKELWGCSVKSQN